MSEKAKGVDTHTPDMEKADRTTTIDTVHADEAMKVLATYSGDESWTDEEEKKIRRKIDRRLLPMLCITYGLQYYDKAMLSQAVCPPLRDIERGQAS